MTYGDAYYIPPIYMWKDPSDPQWPVLKLRQQMD